MLQPRQKPSTKVRNSSPLLSVLAGSPRQCCHPHRRISRLEKNSFSLPLAIFTSNVHHLALSSEPIFHFGHVVDVCLLINMCDWSYLHLYMGKCVLTLACLFSLSFFYNAGSPKQEPRRVGDVVIASSFKPRHSRKNKTTHSGLSLILRRFPKHTETFLYT